MMMSRKRRTTATVMIPLDFARFGWVERTNQVLLAPITKLMGGVLQNVVRHCVLAMAALYALQSLLNSELLPIGLPPTAQKGSFISLALAWPSSSTAFPPASQPRIPSGCVRI